ncbi:MAG: hypothetical protein SH809_01890 [Rhodothermales bacterium]|nr:hypothetical protein [Rhodothermales bacterium]
MRRPSSISLFALLIVTFSPGCRVIDSEDEAEVALFAYASASCAPWDGPALDLVLTTREQSCANIEHVTYGDGPALDFTRLVIYGINEPESGRSWTIDLDEDGGLTPASAGWGQRCPGNEQSCAPIDRATVAFTPAGDDAFTIMTTILYPDGSEDTTRRNVCVCPRPSFPLCG